MTTSSRSHRSVGLGALLLTPLLVLAMAMPAIAQEGAFLVRDSEFSEDGTTTITVAVNEQIQGGLTPEDVIVLENGEPVEVQEVQAIGEGGTAVPAVAVALVIDTSGSTEGEPLAAAIGGAQAFLAELAEIEARVALVSFDDEARVVVPLTEDLEAVADAVSGLQAGGETALYDGVSVAVDQLANVDAQRTAVVFSDGTDTTSSSTAEQAILRATAAAMPVTSVILRSPELDVASLQSLANGTGGSAITVDSAADLAAAFDTVAASITNQFLITYNSELAEPEELNLDLTLALPSGEATQSFTVTNPRRSAPPVVEPPAAEARPGVAGSEVALIVGLVAAFIALAALLMVLVLTPRSRAARHLDRELQGYVEGSDRRANPSAVAEALRQRASLMLERSPSGAEFQSRVQKMLDQGQLPLKTVELLAIMVVGALLLGMLALALIGWRGVIVFAPIGIVAPWLLMLYRRSKRLGRFLEMLPDTLQLMAGSLSAGYGVLQSIDMVTKESEDPMSTEFNRVLVEARLGMPLEESLEAMADRMDSEDFRWVVLAMNIQREVGGNLAQLMQTVSQTLRDREALRRHIRALSAEGKLSAIILVLLPIFLAAYLIVVNPEYVGTLVESFIGWVFIGIGVVGMIIGVIWIRNLIQAIEV